MTEHPGASLQTYLDAYLPQIEGMTMMAGEIADHVDTLTAEEVPAIAKAVAKRKWEFATGRHLAKEAMRRMGMAPRGIRRDSERRPVWPKGCIGSITHAGGQRGSLKSCGHGRLFPLVIVHNFDVMRIAVAPHNLVNHCLWW